MLKVFLSLFFCMVSLCTNAQKKYALLFGISNYNTNNNVSDWNNIHGANDIRLLTPTLKKQGFQVTSILNSKATRKGILKELQKITTLIKCGDIVYIHFSTHGQPFEDFSGDEVDGWDESIVPYDAKQYYKKGVYEGENHIIDDELSIYIDKIRTTLGVNGKVFVVLDACHAGTAFRDVDGTTFVRGTNVGFSRNNKRYTPKMVKKSHFNINCGQKQSAVTYLEACRSYQRNSEIKVANVYYGSLSYYVNKALSKYKIENTSWLVSVEQSMSKDSRLYKQNIVIESTPY